MPGVTDTIDYDSLFTATTKNFKTELEKNFLQYRPVVNLLMDSYGHEESGGYAVQLPAEFGNNAPTKFFTPYGHADTTPTEYALPEIYNFRYLVSAATVSEIEKAANAGKAKLFDLMDGRIRLAVRSMVTLLGSECYSDGTNFGGNTIVGLAAGITTTPNADPASGPVGGIPVAPNPWWKNQATTGCGSFAANGVRGSVQDLVFAQYLNCTDGAADRPNFILSSFDVFEYYNNALLQVARQVQPYGTGDLSFQTLEYQGMPWYADRQCPSGRQYIGNSDKVHFYVDPAMKFNWSEKRTWPDQLLDIRLLTLKTALVYKSRLFLAVLDGWTA